ncbi:MAG TPA: serine protease [Pirellulales bacterium]|nr:serine protease [Pirellulales bacterium]
MSEAFDPYRKWLVIPAKDRPPKDRPPNARPPNARPPNDRPPNDRPPNDRSPNHDRRPNRLPLVALSFVGLSFVGLNAPAPADGEFNVAEARKSVVFVRRITPGRETALGSGFLVSPDGLIYTSRHVIRSSDPTAKGTLVLVGVPSAADPDDLDWFVAEVAHIAGDDELDFALLKIAARDGYGKLRPLPLSLEKLELGASVAVIGYPYVRENQAVLSFNKGSVSATRIRFRGKSYYQTDAAVNHGNSGGPLLNARGEAVGIVTLKELDAENMGFALYLSEIDSAAVAPSKFKHIHPTPGPIDLGQLRLPVTVAPVAANWEASAGRPREEGGRVVHDNRGALFWLTSRAPLPDDFQLVVHCAVEYLLGNQKFDVGQRPSQRNVYIRFGATPGKAAWSGYQVQFGHTALVLSREGKIVKKIAQGNTANKEFRLAVTKQRGRIEVAVDGKTLLEYDDPHPLAVAGAFSIGGYLSRLHLGEVTVIDLTGGRQAGGSAETLGEPAPRE